MQNILIKKIREEVCHWKNQRYHSELYEIKEILDFQYIDYEYEKLRFLRKPQFEALETYLFLRFIKNTQNIVDLYKEYFKNPNDLFEALDIHLGQKDLITILSNGGVDSLFYKIKTDDEFVRRYKLGNIKETISLDYPSYIFSLVMGAGKTILIGAIIFIEFALSLITKNDMFLKNALVFAPGKTILGSLKEISVINVDAIMPKRYANALRSNTKITYTQDKQKNIPIIERSEYNIIITNIEKIRILTKQRERSFVNYDKNINAEEKENIANQRLQQLASLKNLGVFSDEAHNTYGQALGKSIKKVRQTINYLADNTNLVVVVNTTGTPYYKKQILKDVVFWYGLIEGIEENILKDIRGNIYSYAQVEGEEFISQVLDDFFVTYKDIKIYGEQKSKIALYFPRIEDVREIKPFVERKVIEHGLDINAVFEINSKSSDKDKDIFINRINDKNLPYRVFLLVGMGTEGWNCPSLFACGLSRELGDSNNFVLQASTRCLRQIVNNISPARIYLSQKNTKILNTQLQETYGDSVTVHELSKSKNKQVEKKVTLIKYGDSLPQLSIKRRVKRYVKKHTKITGIKITPPHIAHESEIQLVKYDFSKIKKAMLTEADIATIRAQSNNTISIFEATQQLVSTYSLEYFEIYDQLKTCSNADNCMSLATLSDIKQQIEKQINNYDVDEREIEEKLTIVKKSGFNEEVDENGAKVYTTTISIDRDKLETLLRDKDSYHLCNNYSFHYNPYKFDSSLEVRLFEFILQQLHEPRDNIKGFLICWWYY